jgi:hypothetical protein
MNTDIKRKRFTAPNGERIQRSLHERLIAAKPVLEQANNERLTRSDAASRIIIDGIPVSEVTAYNYVRLLGIEWNHRQAYRPRLDREKLRRVVTPLFAKGLPLYRIAEKVGCSTSSVVRFVREEGMVDDDRRYVAPLAQRGRQKKEATR